MISAHLRSCQTFKLPYTTTNALIGVACYTV